MNQDVDYPALLFSPGYNSFEYLGTIKNSETTNKLGLKKGIVLNNFIVDSSGRQFETIRAKKISNINPFWKFEFFNPMIKIELELKRLKNDMPLDDLKSKVLKIINKDPDFWECGGHDLTKFQLLIETSKSCKNLICAIGVNFGEV